RRWRFAPAPGWRRSAAAQCWPRPIVPVLPGPAPGRLRFVLPRDELFPPRCVAPPDSRLPATRLLLPAVVLLPLALRRCARSQSPGRDAAATLRLYCIATRNAPRRLARGPVPLEPRRPAPALVGDSPAPNR